jgi:hypothetical protein
MKSHSVRCCAFFIFVVVSAMGIAACGGRSPDLVTDTDGAGGDAIALDAGTCLPEPCPSGAPWNASTCSCESVTVGNTDASDLCTSLSCPVGYVVGLVGASCVCLQLQQQEVPDVWVSPPAEDASLEDSTTTVGLDVWYVPPPDGDLYYAEAGDAYSYPPPTDAISCPYYYYYGCDAGYTLGANCQCEACPNTCPPGQVAGNGCTGCYACTAACPAGFHYGTNCSCVPNGIDAGPPPDASDGGGVSCLLQGYNSCPAGTWCQLGTCPGGTTQYGCYCGADGTATCSVTCPVPPPCTIPGQASCPAGSQCVYGSCASNPTGDLLVCSCNSYAYGGGNNASCYTASCADGGPQYLDAGNPGDGGGVRCLLEGYTSCPAGSWCSLGTCPDGTTQYGCQCNQDGTATCNLVCPQPAPCQIPGEGSCPYGHQCLFGCNGTTTGTGLSCSCNYGGSAYCSTASCSGSVGYDN